MFATLLTIALAAAPTSAAAKAPLPVIRPGAVWLDTAGKQIQAHGGGIIRHEGRYWWFGEDRTPGNDPKKRFVGCYWSTDLATWTSCGQALALAPPPGRTPRWVLERPKVFYNRPTKTFVMYAHLDDATPEGTGNGYSLAEVAVATSKTIAGPYTYVRSFRPLGKESRDIGQFIDDDGRAYLIFESRPTGGFYIASLSRDYLDVEKEVAFIKAPVEGGAIVRYKGLYYALGSHLTGWRANPNVYATARSLKGPWSEWKDFAPPQTNTYNSQSSNLIKVTGSRTTSVIYVGDRWTPANGKLWDSRYIWMPLKIGDGQLELPAPADWRIDVRTGETEILTKP